MSRKGSVINNIKLVFISQVVVLLASIVRTILIPKIISVEEHGYWQTYLLYVSYISIFYLGFNDGIYLRYAKMKRREMKDNKLSSTLFVFICVSLIEMLIGILIVTLVASEPYKEIFILVLLNVPMTGLFGTITYYLQITDKMKQYSIGVVIEKVLFIVLLIVSYTLGKISPYRIMFLDLFCVAFITIIILIRERRILLTLKPDIKMGIKEYSNNVKAGIKLMIGTYIALLFTGITKVFISAIAPIEQFSYYSFALSITNVVIVCIGTLGNAIYPQIVKREKEMFGYYYDYMNKSLNQIKPFIFYAYYAGCIAVSIILPAYKPALQFLGLMFIVVMLQVKINVINNTYYKLLRKEKRMLNDNLASLIQLLIGCIILKDIYYIIIWQIVVMAYRVVRSEYRFRKKMKILKNYNVLKNCLPYIVFTISLLLEFKIGMGLYTGYAIVHFILNYKEMLNLAKLFLFKKKGEKINE